MVVHPIDMLREMLAREIERTSATESFMIRSGLLADLLDELARHRHQSGRTVPSHEVDADGNPSDDSDPWFQIGWLKDRLERAETERDEWKERSMSLRISTARSGRTGAGEALREALAEAYRKGATDVHSYWVNNPGEPPRGDPEFGEAASDYATAALDLFDSSARAALAQPVEAGEDGT